MHSRLDAIQDDIDPTRQVTRSIRYPEISNLGRIHYYGVNPSPQCEPTRTRPGERTYDPLPKHNTFYSRKTSRT
ncbi:MAG TPA: hypothetical protein VGJ64_01850 [Gemmatimonadaceae bacterium]